MAQANQQNVRQSLAAFYDAMGATTRAATDVATHPTSNNAERLQLQLVKAVGTVGSLRNVIDTKDAQ